MWSFRFNRSKPEMDKGVLPIAVGFLCLAVFSVIAKADVIRSVNNLSVERIELLGDNELEISQGESASMKYRGAKEDVTPFTLRGKTLRLGVDENGRSVAGVKFKVVVDSMQSLTVIGSGQAYITPLNLDELNMNLDGSGDIRAHDLKVSKLRMLLQGSGDIKAERVEAENTQLHVKGSGDLQLGELITTSLITNLDGSGDIKIHDEGRAEDITLRLLGSGDISLGKLQAARATVTIIGSGDIEVDAREALEAEILGSGDIVYSGRPALNQSVVGSGDVRQRD